MNRDHDIFDIMLVKIFTSKDSRPSSEKFTAAMKLKTEVLQRQVIWLTVSDINLPQNANVIGLRFGLQMENYQTLNEAAKARYVVLGNNDQDKLFVVRDFNLLRSSSCRIILSAAACRF